jgi:hypothetical protein
MSPHCANHNDLLGRVRRMEKRQDVGERKFDSLATKLNLILGGIIISPFIVTVLTLLIKVPSN